MAIIVPTINATTPGDFAARIDRVKPFATRLHVDVSDGIFSNTRTISLSQVYDIDGIPLDLHLMVEHPQEYIENVVALCPSLVIIHAEVNQDRLALIRELQSYELRVGLAVQASTRLEDVVPELALVDHLLIFTGTLGKNGGTFDEAGLLKLEEARKLYPQLELSVDGGIDQVSARQAVEAGANVLYTGSFIHNADDPELAYIALDAIAQGQS